MRRDDASNGPQEPGLFAASYGPAVRSGKTEIDVWTNAFTVGEPLPTVPVRTIAGLFVALDFEAVYLGVCWRRRTI